MKNQKISLLVFLSLFVAFSFQQLPDQKKIDDECAECTNSMIYIESRIALRLSNFSDQIQKCSDDLKAANGPKLIGDALDNLRIVVSQIGTIKNHNPYENIETCSQINFKIISMDLERAKMNWIVQQINTNISLLSQRNSQLITQYSLNLNRGLSYLSTLERKVYEIFTSTPQMINELLSYLPTLQICIGKMSTMTMLMNAFRTKYCQCLARVSWTSSSNDSSLSSNLEVLESQLRSMQSRISNFSTSALTLVRRASSETGNVYLPPLQVVLERQNRADYPSSSWPNVQNCNDLFNRGKFLTSKQIQYLQLLPPSNLDCSLISFYLNAISSTRSNSVTLNNAINAVRSVESSCKNYIQLLIAALVRVSVMSGNVNSMGDTFCTCGVITTTTTTTSTTTTTVATTTTQPSCGTLASWTIGASNGPDVLGFPSGTYYDGATIYPGVSDISRTCGIPHQAPGPVRITTTATSKPAGAYYSCSTAEIYGTTSITFYLNHPNLSWRAASSSTLSSIPGTLPIASNAGTAYVGRINLNYANGTFQQIGKVFGGRFYYIYDGVRETSTVSGYEVLACGTSPATTTSLSPSSVATTTGGILSTTTINGVTTVSTSLIGSTTTSNGLTTESTTGPTTTISTGPTTASSSTTEPTTTATVSTSTTESTSTTTRPTTTLAAVTGRCTDIWPINDSSGFTYKKICRFPSNDKHIDADANCKLNNMRLLTIRNQREFDATIALMKKVWGATPGNGIKKHVDGVKGSDGKWRYYDGVEVWDGIKPIYEDNRSELPKIYTHIHGDDKGGFFPLAHPNEESSFSLCEFDVLRIEPTGPAVTPRTPLNTADCDKFWTITATSKRICRQHDGVNFPTAYSRCLNYGMRLLTIRDQQELDSVKAFMLSIGGSVDDHIDGTKGSDGIWRFYDGTAFPAFLVPTNGTGNFRTCVNFKGNSNGYYPYAVDANDGSYYMCEY